MVKIKIKEVLTIADELSGAEYEKALRKSAKKLSEEIDEQIMAYILGQKSMFTKKS